MKKLFAVLILLTILIACQQQTPRVPKPTQSYPAPAGMAYWDYDETSASHIMRSGQNKQIGPAEFKIYAYGAKETKSAMPGTPLEYRIWVAEKASGSPAFKPDSELTIMLTSINSNGMAEIFATPNVPTVHPNNFLRYDSSMGEWVTPRGIAQSDIGTQNFIVLISYKGQNKLIRDTLNVR